MLRVMGGGLLAAGAIGYTVTGGFGPSNFTVQINASPSEVYTQLAANAGRGSPLQDANILSQSVHMTTSNGNTIRYVIPSSEDSDGSIITLAVSPDETGGSRISASVDVPSVKISETLSNATGQKYVSEHLVTVTLRSTLRNFGQALEQGRPLDSAGVEINTVLDAVALATNPSDLDDLSAMLSIDPSWASSGLFDPSGARDYSEEQIDTQADQGGAMANPDYDVDHANGMAAGNGYADDW